MSNIKFVLGESDINNNSSFLAGKEAALSVKNKLKNEIPIFSLVYSTPDHDRVQLYEGINSILGNVPSIIIPVDSLITRSVIKKNHFVIIFLIIDKRINIIMEYAEGAIEKSKQIGSYLAEKIFSKISSLKNKHDHSMILLFVDNRLYGDKSTKGFASIFGSFCPVVGCAIHCMDYGDIYINGKSRPNIIAGILINSPTPVSVGVSHGWQSRKIVAVATKTRDSCLIEINGKPAFNEYYRIWKDIYPDIKNKIFSEKQIDFNKFALCHPIGLAQAKDEYLIRDPYLLNEDGSINCGGDINENSILHFMSSNEELLLKGVKSALKKAQDAIGPLQSIILFFDCISRSTLPNYDFNKEIQLIIDSIDEQIPIIGILCRGEIATPTTGMIQFHNKTIAISII